LTRDRILVWDGCVNVRDLGGLPVESGGETQFGSVVRADSIRGLTDRGWQALLDYGVRSAIDLRAADEVAADPRVDSPIRVVHAPLAPSNLDWPSMRSGYLELLETARPRFAHVAVLVSRTETPVVVHCQGGRDRTGLVVALLLALAGVDYETIAADHALSDESWAPYLDAFYAEAETEQELERRRRITAAAGRTMAEILEEVGRRHGGVRRYLAEGGAAHEDLDRIVLRLRGAPPDRQ
jgi:protein tyrosine/serine phosphatase